MFWLAWSLVLAQGGAPAPAPPSSAAAQGNAAYRRGEIVRAEELYREAVRQDERDADALLGLAKIHAAVSMQKEADRILEAAYHFHPEHRSVQIAWGRRRPTVEERIAMLERAARQMNPTSDEAAELRLEIDAERARGERRTVRRSELRETTIRLARLGTPGYLTGYGIALRVNGKAVTLVFDTSAEGVRVTRAVARRLGLERLAERPRVAGQPKIPSYHRPGDRYLAARVAAGSVEFENVPVEVVDGIGGQDGVISPALFEDFLVDIDWRRYQITLRPHPGEGKLPGFHKVFRFGSGLVLGVQVRGLAPKLFAIDSGNGRSLLDPDAGLGAPSGDREPPDYAAYRRIPISFANVINFQVNFDASSQWRLSEKLGLALSGRLGADVLRSFETTIDYRNGAVRFQPVR